MRTSRTTATLALAGGVLAMSVAACGTDNNTQATASTKSASSAATTAAPAPSTAAVVASGSAAAGGTAPCAKGSISGAGSTFQQNMETQWAKDFGAKCAGSQVNYQGVGSGAGIQQLGSGTVDFAGSDVTMKDTEKAAADKACGSPTLTIPITAGGVAIIYNVKGLSTPLKLSATTLAGIFEGKIAKWNDAAIATDNSGVTLPNTPISVFYRSDASGTTSVFTSFEKALGGSAWTLGAGKTVSWTTGQGAKGSDGVTAGVAQTDGGITYAEVSFAQSNNLPTAQVKGAGTNFAAISADSVSKAIAAGFTVTGTGNDLAGTLDFTKMTDGYPISTVSYALVCSQYKDAAKGSLVKAFLTYAATAGQQAADSLGFAPLPTDLAAKDQASLAAVK